MSVDRVVCMLWSQYALIVYLWLSRSVFWREKVMIVICFSTSCLYSHITYCWRSPYPRAISNSATLALHERSIQEKTYAILSERLIMSVSVTAMKTMTFYILWWLRREHWYCKFDTSRFCNHGNRDIVCDQSENKQIILLSINQVSGHCNKFCERVFIWEEHLLSWSSNKKAMPWWSVKNPPHLTWFQWCMAKKQCHSPISQMLQFALSIVLVCDLIEVKYLDSLNTSGTCILHSNRVLYFLVIAAPEVLDYEPIHTACDMWYVS